MEMRYFWVTDQVHRQILVIIWQPGAENLADYFSKHQPGSHHKRYVRGIFILQIQPDYPYGRKHQVILYYWDRVHWYLC